MPGTGEGGEQGGRGRVLVLSQKNKHGFICERCYAGVNPGDGAEDNRERQCDFSLGQGLGKIFLRRWPRGNLGDKRSRQRSSTRKGPGAGMGLACLRNKKVDVVSQTECQGEWGRR